MADTANDPRKMQHERSPTELQRESYNRKNSLQDVEHGGANDYGTTNHANRRNGDSPSLDYSRFCWRKKKRCSKRLMNTGF
jgi:hypothetical protein